MIPQQEARQEMKNNPTTRGGDPVIEAYKRHIDRTLIRENLRDSIDERIQNLIALQRFAAALREAGRNAHRQS